MISSDQIGNYISNPGSIQLDDIDGAKKTLRDLIAQYPDHALIPNAKRRLAVLDSIKK